MSNRDKSCNGSVFVRGRHATPLRTDLPSPEKREEYEERAAIMEFCAGMTREAAEKAAWDLLFGTRFLKQTLIDFDKESTSIDTAG